MKKKQSVVNQNEIVAEPVKKNTGCRFVGEDGTVCGSPFAKYEWGDTVSPHKLCRRHAVKSGLILDVRKKRGAPARKRAKMKETWKSIYASKLFTDIAKRHKDPFNILDILPPLRKVNPIPGDPYGAEKYCYAMWLIAGRRYPENVDEVAAVLGVSYGILDSWYRSDWLPGLLNVEFDNKIIMSRYFVDKIVTEKALELDPHALKLFYKRVDQAVSRMEARKKEKSKQDGAGGKKEEEPDVVSSIKPETNFMDMASFGEKTSEFDGDVSEVEGEERADENVLIESPGAFPFRTLVEEEDDQS